MKVVTPFSYGFSCKHRKTSQSPLCLEWLSHPSLTDSPVNSWIPRMYPHAKVMLSHPSLTDSPVNVVVLSHESLRSNSVVTPFSYGFSCKLLQIVTTNSKSIMLSHPSLTDSPVNREFNPSSWTLSYVVTPFFYGFSCKQQESWQCTGRRSDVVTPFFLGFSCKQHESQNEV